MLAADDRRGCRSYGSDPRTLRGDRLGGVTYDFDTWPDLPTFLEIEGSSEAAVKEAVAGLGLDYDQARFGSIDLIYKSEVGRDILAEPTLLFA